MSSYNLGLKINFYIFKSKKTGNFIVGFFYLSLNLSKKPFLSCHNILNMIKNRILVTGGAGLLDSLYSPFNEDNEVICLDNFFTGSKDNVKNL